MAVTVVLAVAGFVLIVAGLSAVYPPAGVIFAGAGLLAAAYTRQYLAVRRKAAER